MIKVDIEEIKSLLIRKVIFVQKPLNENPHANQIVVLKDGRVALITHAQDDLRTRFEAETLSITGIDITED